MSAKNKEKHNKCLKEKKSAYMYSIQNIKEKLEVYNHVPMCFVSSPINKLMKRFVLPLFKAYK